MTAKLLKNSFKYVILRSVGVRITEVLNVTEAISCGGIVIHKWKILLLYKNQNGKYMGWVLPKGTVESGECHSQTALREVKEESGTSAKIIKYVGKTQYSFHSEEDIINKTVHWYLMETNSIFTASRKVKNSLRIRGFINFMRPIICLNLMMKDRF